MRPLAPSVLEPEATGLTVVTHTHTHTHTHTAAFGLQSFWGCATLCDFCAGHSCAHALRLCFALNATLQLVALVATAVALTAYARMHFVVGHHFLDSPEKGMCFSSWLFLKVPILRRRAELEAQGYQPPPSLPTEVGP